MNDGSPEFVMNCSETFAKIEELRKRLSGTPHDCEILRDAFAGRTAIVFSCGPSLRRWKNVLDMLGNDVVIACVKQSIVQIDRPAHLHFLNPQNLQRYDYPTGARPLQIFSNSHNGPVWFASPDLVFQVSSRPGMDFRETLAATRMFGKHKIDRTGLTRPWGPGIMYESVFYTLLHLGFSHVVTLGWDIADPRGQNKHFYDGSGAAKSHSSTTELKSNCNWLQFGGILFRRIARLLRITHIYKYGLHLSGKRYNPTPMQPGEAPLVAAAAPDFIAWLASEGMTVDVISDSGWLATATDK